MIPSLNFLPQSNCIWLKPDGEFIENVLNEHTDFIKIAGCITIKEFVLRTKWIKVRGFGDTKVLVFSQVQPFTKDQRNTIKDLEMFGYDCQIHKD